MLKNPFENKKILITGACGSIGQELSQQIAKYRPGLLILTDLDETGLFYLRAKFREKFPKLNFLVKIFDIKDLVAVREIIKSYKPEIIFHTAAFKHVSMMENQPREAVLNNILGTKVLADTAVKFSVNKFIYISTDKAANPISIMGASKKISEKMLSEIKNKKTNFIVVRFGNVLGSRGSVAEIFEDQIIKGGPLTITDPKMTRYFISTKEAVYLVLQAAKIGKNKNVFILDMGKPVKILNLAKKMIKKISPGKEIKIKIIGKLPGEKITEELYSMEEKPVKTTVKRLLKISNKKSNKYSQSKIEKLILLAQKTNDEKRINKMIFEIIGDKKSNLI